MKRNYRGFSSRKVRFLKDVIGMYDIIYKAGTVHDFMVVIGRYPGQDQLVEGHGYGTPVTPGIDIEYIKDKK